MSPTSFETPKDGKHAFCWWRMRRLGRLVFGGRWCCAMCGRPRTRRRRYGLCPANPHHPARYEVVRQGAGW